MITELARIKNKQESKALILALRLSNARVDRRVLLDNERCYDDRLCRKFCRSNGWFAPRSGVGQALDEVNSRIRAA